MSTKQLTLTVNDNYLRLVPRPTTTQLNSLRNSIQEDGQQVKIIINQDGVILDGHTRFNICKELDLEPKYTIKKFDSIEKEKEFVISTNVNRRQLTLFERGEVLFSWWKEEKKRSNSEGGYSRWETRRTGIIHGGTTLGKKERLINKFARIIGTSATPAHEIIWLLLHADEDTKKLLRKEEITIAAAYLQLAKPKRKPRSEYGNYPVHAKCLDCGAPTIAASETNCHVHTQLCCTSTKCGWGN